MQSIPLHATPRLYPPDIKAPSGKARLLYEVAPMSMLAEQAGAAGCEGSAFVHCCLQATAACVCQ